MANNHFPDQRTVERVRKMYPGGTRVELIQMDDQYSHLKPGDKDTVRLVGDTATIFVDWDSGSGLGIVYGEDRVGRL